MTDLQRVRKVANRFMRMYNAFLDEESTPIIEKIENAYREFMGMFHEFKEDICVLESKKAGISLPDQKAILRRLLSRSGSLHGYADVLYSYGEEIATKNKSNPKIKDIYIKIRNALISMMTELHKTGTYTHTPTEHNDMRIQQNNFGEIKRKYDILIGKL